MPQIEIPKSYEFEITRDQVFDNIFKLIEDMSNIRRECINSRKIDEGKAQEYLQLASFLSKSLLSVTSASANRRLHKIVDTMNAVPAMIYFDTMQRRYWEKHQPDFLANLDSVLIQIYGERFESLDRGHHLISAVKCVCAQNEERPEEKMRILESVLPVCGIVRGVNLQTIICEGIMDNGADWKNLDRQLCLNVHSLEDVIEKMVSYARQTGVLSVEIPLTREQYDSLIKKFPDALPVGSVNFHGKQAVKTKFIVNKVPEEKPAKQVQDRLEKFLEERELVELYEEYAPNNPGAFLAEISLPSFGREAHDKVMGRLRKVNCLEEIKGLSLGELETKLVSIVKEFVRYPQTYGFLIGDRVEINKLVTEDEGNEESIWKGSYGEIRGVSHSYSVEFHTGKGKAKGKGKDVVLCEIEERYLEKEGESKTSFPSWYERGKIEIGDIVKVRKNVLDEFELGDALSKDSIGKVVGLTYDILFEKVCHRDSEKPRTNVEEDGINQAYLTRTKTLEQSDIEKLVHEEVAAQVQRVLAKSKSGIKFETVEIGEGVGFSYHEDVEGYDKAVLFFRKGKNYCVLTYISEGKDEKKPTFLKGMLKSLGFAKGDEEGEITDGKIMGYIEGYKGMTRDAFEAVSKAFNPIHITLKEFKDFKRINYFTGYR